MCGIAGLLQFDGSKVDRVSINRMTDLLIPRGPDDYGVFVDDPIALGHTRLAILDLSATGKQPMSYADGRFVITYNGEIYNYLELKDQLEGLGYRFTGSSDTEVILAAYAKWGEECQNRFNGMWAFGIWDRREKTLFLSRDRFGVKPLHYYHDGERFSFASEMKAFLALGRFSLEYDEKILAKALNNFSEVEGSENTLLRGVKRLLAGRCMVIRADGDIKIKRWWNTLSSMQAPRGGFAQQVSRFRELFFDACHIRMRSDVPVAVSLSGGLDSSSVLCALSAIKAGEQYANPQAQQELKAFVASFPGTYQDEKCYAEEVVRHSNVPSAFSEIDVNSSIGRLEEVLFAFEEVYDLPSAPWLLYEKMRGNGFRVSIEGHGGDELLAGYPHYAGEFLRHSFYPFPNPMRYRRLSSTFQRMSASSMPPPGFSFGNDLSALASEKARRIQKTITWTLKKGIDVSGVKRAVVYGCGQGGARALELTCSMDWEVAYFVDSAPEKWGEKFEEFEIRSPDALLKRDYDIIMVASTPGKSQIFKKLDEMGFRYKKDFVFITDSLKVKPERQLWSPSTFTARSARNPWLRVNHNSFYPQLSHSDTRELMRLDPPSRRMFAEFHYTNLPSILRNFDRLSMAHGVEVRSPFMDWRVVCLTLPIPWHSKVGGGFTKKLLRHAMKGIIPEVVRTRPDKLGYNSPVLEWVAGPLKPLILDLTNSREFLESQVWKGPAICDAVARAYTKDDYQTISQFWVYIQAMLLIKVFKDRHRALSYGV
ncbi:MAG TPA: asparagine synthase (glutamine-hydrolyzing) [Nitrospirae bacterium]|nr:asparagine synthase (glutamine-hydrolyzing) [Nitrospirota bacterium]